MTTSNLKRPRSLRVAHTAPSTPFARTTLAIGASTALLLPAFASAQEVVEVKTVSVTVRAPDHNPHGEPGAAYKAKTSGDERRVKPLAETPATITVLTQQQLLDTGRTDLREILRTQPGITLGTGENGNAFGDRYIIRGQEARSDVFVDGLRDPGMTVRESFATEQVEITKGPSATFAGRGATGGAVNSITKQATTDADFTKLSAGVGTDGHRRLTLDANHAFSDNAALRINLLEAYEEVPNRDPADRARKGVALSLNVKPTSQLDVTADYYRMEAKDSPDMGAWLDRNNQVVENVPVYVQSEDFLKSTIDTWSLRLNYRATDTLRITNLTRYGTTENGYIMTSAALPGLSTNPSYPTLQPNAARLASHNGWQNVEYIANQTNVFFDATLAGLKHQFIASLELSDHKVVNGKYTLANNGAYDFQQQSQNGTGPVRTSNIYLAAPLGATSIHDRLQRTWTKNGTFSSDWKAKTVATSIMDTVDLNEQWTVTGGLRHDRVSYDNTVTSDNATYSLNDGLWNAQAGVIYKFRPDANVYLNLSTATDFNGGESDVTNCDYGGLCLVGSTVAEKQANFKKSKPEKSTNIELGTKWNLLDNKLLATAAVFQVTKTDIMESAAGNSYSTTGTINTGKYKVEGAEFGLSGNLTNKLSVQAGVAFLKGEILKSYTASNVGKTLSNLPETSGTVLLSYKLTPNFTFGGSVTHHSEKFNGRVESAAGTLKVPGYTTMDLFASYKFNRNLRARINVGNVTNENYYLSIYNNAGKFVYLGDARNVRATLNYDF